MPKEFNAHNKLPELSLRYQIRETLAQGSDCSTYLVLDREQEQLCILKVLTLKTLGDWKRLELFKREARTLAHLTHPQIPALLDYFETTESGVMYCCLVIRRVPGQTLAERVYRGLHLSEEHAFLIAVQVLRILDYLHSFQPPVIHRDVKPSNLLLDDQGILYLIDFGGVQEALMPSGAGGSTMIGTYGYMAPEQFSGRALPQSDLYGLGATLVFLLSGREPANMPQQNLLLNFRPYVDCSARFANWIEHLLQPAPEQRFTTALQALEVLKEILPHFARLNLPEIQHEVSRAIQVDLKHLEHTGQEDYSDVPDAQLLQAGDIVRQSYQIEEILGQGDIAITYAAFSVATQQKVVLRELHFERLQHWKSYEHFEREVNILSRLDHPALPHMIEHFELKHGERHRFYLVSERIEALNLDQKMRQGWRPTEVEVREIARQLLDILNFLQSQDPPLIHRDVKPSNILMDTSGRVYLIDFGAVQESFRRQGGGGSTVIGTFGYMAPEQFVGKAVPQTDLYGLGTSLVHLMAGVSPAEMPQQELRLQFVDQVACSRTMFLWLERLLEPRVEDRFVTPLVAMQELERLDNRPITSLELLDSAQKILSSEDPAIQIQEGVNGLQLRLMPMFHDYKPLLILFAGGNIVGVPLLFMVPQIGILLALSVLVGSGMVVGVFKQHGKEYITTIDLDSERFHYQTVQMTDDGPKVLDNLEYSTHSVASFYLEQFDIPNRLCVRIQLSPESRPILKMTKYPLTQNKLRAEYMLKRLRDSLSYYHSQLG